MAEVKYVLMLCAVVTATAWGLGLARSHKNPVACGREVFDGLVAGKPAVAKQIAWERFSAVGVDVGASYRQLADKAARRTYERLYVESFAKGFRDFGGQPGNFVRWRETGEAEAYTVVAADYPAKGKTLLLAVSKQHPRQVAAINWQ